MRDLLESLKQLLVLEPNKIDKISAKLFKAASLEDCFNLGFNYIMNNAASFAVGFNSVNLKNREGIVVEYSFESETQDKLIHMVPKTFRFNLIDLGSIEATKTAFNLAKEILDSDEIRKHTPLACVYNDCLCKKAIEITLDAMQQRNLLK